MFVRDQILREIESIESFDSIEESQKQDVIGWIQSGVELCRIRKPAIPPKHLVSYFVVVDQMHVLLVDHRNAKLWLPTGGHVEPGEHPRNCVAREAQEELGITAEFLIPHPLFLTCTETVGLAAGHTDVSIWYVLRGDRNAMLDYDRVEFLGIRWFSFEQVPLERCDPHMGRFLDKLTQLFASFDGCC
jgi:8-oxo-dGTP pyrophosphatase MutT (NUDIX family)